MDKDSKKEEKNQVAQDISPPSTVEVIKDNNTIIDTEDEERYTFKNIQNGTMEHYKDVMVVKNFVKQFMFPHVS